MNPHPEGSSAHDWWEFHQAVNAFADTVRPSVLAVLRFFLRYPVLLVVWALLVAALIVATSRP